MLLLSSLSFNGSDILGNLSKALAEIGGQGEPGKVWYQLGVALRSAGLYEEAATALERCIETDPKAPRAVHAALIIARLATLTANWERAENILNWAEKQSLTEEERINLATVNAGVSVHRQEIKKAYEMLSQVIKEVKESELKRPESLAYAFISLAGISILLGKFEQAEASFEEARRVLQNVTAKRNRDRGLTIVFVNLGELYRLKGELEKSQEILQKALKLAETHGLQDFLADARMNLAHTLAESGKNLDQAEELLTEAEAFYRSHEHHADLIEILLIRAKILWQREKKEEALKLAQEALQKAVEYALQAKEATIAETLYHWTGKVSYKLQAVEAYQKIGNEARAQALKGD